MVTILTGNECTGKSTCFGLLRKNFEDKKDVLFVKGDYTNDIEEKWRRACYINSLIESKQEAVFDRMTVIDDIVYSLVIDGEKSPFASEIFVHNILRRCRIIYFDSSLDLVVSRLLARGDEYIRPRQVELIHATYEHVFDEFGLDPVRIDVSKLTKEQVYQKVLEVLEW